LSGGRDGGGFFDLSGSDRPGGQQTSHDADARRDMTIAAPPASDASRVDAEPLRGAVLCEAVGIERRAEFSRGRGARASLPERYVLPFWGVRVDGDRHCDVPDLDLS
jgi:hypothetical protein